MERRYRIIQWGTGRVGTLALRHFAQNRAFELIGVHAHSAAKVGRDAGEIADTDSFGVAATDDVEALLALDADCVFYCPAYGSADVDLICRMLRSGKNVVSSTYYFHPTARSSEAFAKIEAACRDGGVTYYGGGLHPGYAGDILVMTLCRVMSRVEKVHVYEIVDFAATGPDGLRYLNNMGYGATPGTFKSLPNNLATTQPEFEQAIQIIADGLGRPVDRVTSNVEISVATADIEVEGFRIPAGTVAAQHHEWTGHVDGKPLIVFHAVYTVGYDNLDPPVERLEGHYKVVVEGDPMTNQLVLDGHSGPASIGATKGYVWTAMACVNAIPAVTDAPSGVASQFSLGLVKPVGLVR